MTALTDFLRLNARWLLAGFLLTFASSFGQTFFISVYSAEIRMAFGLSDGQWGAIYAFATMASAGVMVFVGGLTDRFRVRWIGVVILAGLAAAALAMSVATEVWALILVVFLLRLMGQGMMGHTAMVGMARWFVATRGRAVSIAGLGVAVGEALLPLAFVALMAVFDWRLLWVAAAMILIVLAPVLWSLLQRERTPASFVQSSSSLGMEGRAWTRGEVARHWLFWMLVPMVLGPAAWNTALFFHQVHLAEGKGWSHLEFVQLFPVYTLAAVSAMLLSGAAVDRFGNARVASVYFLPGALGFVLLGLAATPGAALFGMVLIGATAGANSTIGTTLWAEYFGTRHLGRIRAMTTALMVVGSAIGPSVTGALIDAGMTFDRQTFWIGGYYLLTAALTGFAVFRAAPALRTPSAPEAPR
ncbi:MAG: MFS transporter [Alphaproteobacteria bacterium]|nr:MFS transporter [Alphaproteobacteria bacterium]